MWENAIMTLPLSSGTPGKSERSHGRSRFAHPDSDYQSQRTELPFEVSDRNQGSKRGGFTADMKRQAELRLDATNSTETVEEMLYVLGNPDAFGPDQPIVQEKMNRAPSVYKSNTPRTGVYRQE
jgi:hypothetical protein